MKVVRKTVDGVVYAKLLNHVIMTGKPRNDRTGTGTIFDYTTDDIELLNYAPHPAIKAGVSV